MGNSSRAHSFAAKFIDHCNREASEIAKGLVAELDEVPASEQEDFIAFCVSDALVHFFYDSLKLQLQDPEGAQRLQRILASKAGRASGKKRADSGVKWRFVRWAQDQHARNPRTSKNELAAKYAKDNPGVAVATLRRYLASLQEWDD